MPPEVAVDETASLMPFAHVERDVYTGSYTFYSDARRDLDGKDGMMAG